MSDDAEASSDGLVKKLFFPAYTTAGFNENFALGSLSIPNSQHPPRADSIVLSEASTAVCDNRSQLESPSSSLSRLRATRTTATATAATSTATATTKTTTTRGVSNAESTIKAVITNGIVSSDAVSPLPDERSSAGLYESLPDESKSSPPSMPASPPKLSRLSRNDRTESNTAVVAHTTHRSMVDDDAILRSTTTVTPVVDAVVPKGRNGEIQTVVAAVTKEALALQQQQQKVSSDQTSRTSSSSPEAFVQNRSVLDDVPSWEEEATPAQTAFGKQLIFQRVLRRQSHDDDGDDNDEDDEIRSTDSDRGSHVESQQERLRDVHNTVEELLVEDTLRSKAPLIKPSSRKRSERNGSFDTARSHQSYVDPGVLDGPSILALPILDGTVGKTSVSVGKSNEAVTGRLSPSVLSSSSSSSSPPQNADKGGTAVTDMLSMAIRRFGSGLGTTSAPTTPRSMCYQYQTHDTRRTRSQSAADYAAASLSPPATPTTPRSFAASFMSRSSYEKAKSSTTAKSRDAPSSFLLRSPGSAAFQAAAATMAVRPSPLTPRYSAFQQRRVSMIPEDAEAAPSHRARLPNNANAMQIARSCFSYDAYDTNMDDQYEVTVPNFYNQSGSNGGYVASSSFVEMPSSDVESSAQLLKGALPFRKTKRTMRASASWDSGVNKERQASAFRPRTRGFHHRAQSNITLGAVSTHKSNPTHLMNNCSPSSVGAQQLKTPQRIEIERDDALDILACLVERGVSWKDDACLSTPEVIIVKEATPVPDVVSRDEQCVAMKLKPCTTPSVADITAVVEELHGLSLAEENLSDFHCNSEAHQKRKLALEELVRSHEYALEMKRASKSASSWLKSIGRSPSLSPTKNNASPLRSGGTESGRAAPNLESTMATNDSAQHAANDSSVSESIDLLASRAKLHAAQLEAKEKTQIADKLNEELAKCRAEIGRLKSAARGSSFRSPNRSILDESDELSATEDDDEENIHLVRSGENENALIDETACAHSSFLREMTKPSNLDQSDELAQYKAALDEANRVIRRLHVAVKKTTAEFGSKQKEPPIVLVENQNNIQDLKKTESPGFKEERSVNVRMLDGENFVTDWDQALLQSVPDHELRSPIVAAVLEAWTGDQKLHESLLAWADDILAGKDPDSIPPLTLSNLDHQVRDGFTLHVLPLLLRRRDIRVDMQMRVKRRTSYDIAVSVESTMGVDEQDPHMILHSDHLENLSARSDVGSKAADSSTSTTLVSNKTSLSVSIPEDYVGSTTKQDMVGDTPGAASSRLSYDEMAENIGSPDDLNTGLISALGGALGGLLRRKSGVPFDHESLPPEGPHSNMQTILESPASADLASEQFVGLAEPQDDQPYHRVVSAPPGRIGVTFVEYRGHCMVSDVNPESPLIGWIFPSDVLIAIDELPVSGMRVRDIIIVLKDRFERTRALRVISSHAMNEFTLNSSVIIPDENS